MKTPEAGSMAEERIQVLGKVIANISHELKNALATVSESAGLLSDILSGPDPVGDESEEIRSCSEAITEDLRRAFGVIRNLNTFAHTADEPIREVDAAGMVELAAALAGYLSFAGPISLRDPGDGPVRISTCPLLLVDLIYRVLESAFRLSRHRSTIGIGVRAVGGGAEVRFSELGNYRIDDLIPDEGRRVLGALHAHVVLNTDAGELGIRLPARMGEKGGC